MSGTTALTVIKSTVLDSSVLVRLMRFYDGSPRIHGKAIKEALNNGDCHIVPYTNGVHIPSSFHGMGCLAAYLIGKLKGKSIGNIELIPNNFNYHYQYLYILYEGRPWDKENDRCEVYIKVINTLSEPENYPIYQGSIKDWELC